MKKRIIGIDVARALAVIGMIIVNFKVVFGDHGEGWLKSFAHLFDGKAAATFVVLAGVGLALMTNSAIAQNDSQKLSKAYRKIVKRAIFLFVVGLSYIWIWPADILHFYGIYMLATLFFIRRKSMHIIIGTLGFILLFPLLLVFFDYENGWDFSSLSYLTFWTPSGFFRNLFFNGFHPVIPWTAFMLFGLWYGKQDLNDTKFLKKSLVVSTIAFVGLQVFSAVMTQGSANQEDMLLLFGTDPMPPMPMYMFNGISTAVMVISGCILLGRQFEDAFLLKALNQTGQLALTFYVAHVVLGMGLLESFGSKALGEYSIQFSVVYALIFGLLCIVFAVIWLKYKKMGPLEWVMRKLTD